MTGPHGLGDQRFSQDNSVNCAWVKGNNLGRYTNVVVSFSMLGLPNNHSYFHDGLCLCRWATYHGVLGYQLGC